MVVASGKDHSEYMNTAQQVARLIPNSEVVEMAQVRHWPGANEARTWIAAIAAGNRPMETVVYEPVREWITGMAIAASL